MKSIFITGNFMQSPYKKSSDRIEIQTTKSVSQSDEEKNKVFFLSHFGCIRYAICRHHRCLVLFTIQANMSTLSTFISAIDYVITSGRHLRYTKQYTITKRKPNAIFSSFWQLFRSINLLRGCRRKKWIKFDAIFP